MSLPSMLIRSPCVTRGRGNLNVSHVLHVGNFAILSQNMYDQATAGSGDMLRPVIFFRAGPEAYIFRRLALPATANPQMAR